ncbi:cyclopropane-fatty-acyl-phospholipid synthase family protein [Endozoicomonas sp. SCSIO W0465]|uniref:SAM-dependent methyltransferase n=1 Tax=Endozoicomonas sp. SCSIO W0465 TaxID=2918516 RepID=UPI0020760CFE|nr:cyclopropane-fatty-acyl-phospholipid synthase family protein [Endozoicomonas sp. SCSIO W0465]USE37192.1 cyclopropane-fatty-acyl-phospholipid synthase family protein [Endozoicomonas sp. SCSIO W0465]
MNSTSSTEITAKPLFPALRKVLSWLEKRLIKAGVSRIELRIDGNEGVMVGQFKSGTPIPCLQIHNPVGLIQQSSQGLLGWSESYINGDWSTPDLRALTDWAMVNEDNLQGVMASNWLSNTFNRLLHRLRRNSCSGSRRNIAAHYDLGNDFYRQWLDASMTYSSALYLEEHEDLETAQSNKYNTIVDWLELRPGSSVLEIGCGWGGFARTLSQRHNGAYHGITLSKEQLAYAQRAHQDVYQDVDKDTRTEPLPDNRSHQFSLTDYRDIHGQFDHIVSIEMIEAVGEELWPTYFEKIYNSLKPGGSAVIQAILIDNARFEAYRRGVDFIQRYIFPGGMLPSDRVMKEQTSKAGLAITNRLSFGLDYAKTLGEWKRHFLTAWPTIEKLGFDQRFKRMWQFYLDYCATGFQFKSIDVCLYKLSKPVSVEPVEAMSCQSR